MALRLCGKLHELYGFVMTRIDYLVEIKRRGGIRRVAEIGVLRGSYAAKILQIVEPDALYLIDPWRVFPKDVYTSYVGESQLVWDARYTAVARRFQNDPRVHILRECSDAAAQRFSPGGLDMAFIDGNHAYDFVIQDLKLWGEVVRPGGCLSGHDLAEPSVERALREYFGGRFQDLVVTEAKGYPRDAWFFWKQ